MSETTTGTSPSAEMLQRCPACWQELPPATGDAWVRCGHCGRDVDRSQAQVAQRYREQANRAAAYATYTEGVAAGWRRVADEWHAVAETAAAAAVAPRLMSGAPQAAGPSTAAGSFGTGAGPLVAGGAPPDEDSGTFVTEQGPVTAAPGLAGPAQGEQRPRPGVPTAVLLQGTGAVLILAAVVIVSAVAWTVLSPLGQAILLGGVVLVLGVVSIATRTRVPTTSMVLAGLTAAVYVVVAIAVPTLQAQFDTRWYPFAVAATGSVLLLVAGRLGRIALWRHAGIASLPLAALLLPPALWDLTGPAQWSLAALVLAVLAAALTELAVRQRAADAETAVTASWAAVVLATVAGLATLVAVGATVAGVARSSLTDRLWPAAAVLALAALLVVLGRLAASTGRAAGGWYVTAAATVPLALTIVAVPVSYPSWPVALIPAALLLCELVAGGWAWLAWRPQPARRKIAIGWLSGAVGAVVGYGSLVGAVLFFSLDTTSVPGPWLWLAPHSVGLVLAAAGITFGFLAGHKTLTAGGAAVAVVTWGSLDLGGHLGREVEAFSLPVGGLLLAVGMAASHRWPGAGRRPVPWRAALVLATGVPTFVLALALYAESATLPVARLALLLVLAVAALGLDFRIRGALALVVGAAAVELAAFAFVALAKAEVDVVEPFALVAAVATGPSLLAAHRERLVGRWVPAIASGLVLFIPSLLLVFLDPEFVGPWAGWRAVAVLAILAVVTAASWRGQRMVAASAGSIAIALVAWWYVFWLEDSTGAAVPEAWTVPLALAVTGILWLWLVAAGTGDRRVLLLPAAGVLVVSTFVAIGVPAASGDPRDDVRAAGVVVLWWILAWLARMRFGFFVAATIVAVFLTWYQALAFTVSRVPDPGMEWQTWSAAAAVALATGLIVRQRGRVPSSLVWLAPSVSLVLLPTSLAAWSDGTAGWRLWFVLGAGAVALAVGVLRKWAGAVWPAIVALACVVVPVITRVASDAPAWVPLAIAGTALLALGARFESLRRQGRSAAHWAATLR